jgi:hypothetical protein
MGQRPRLLTIPEGFTRAVYSRRFRTDPEAVEISSALVKTGTWQRFVVEASDPRDGT